MPMLLISLSIRLDNKLLQTKRHKELEKNTEETNGCMRPERANKVAQLHESYKKKKKKKKKRSKKKKKKKMMMVMMMVVVVVVMMMMMTTTTMICLEQ